MQWMTFSKILKSNCIWNRENVMCSDLEVKFYTAELTNGSHFSVQVGIYDLNEIENFISSRKLAIKESEELVKKYDKQLGSIKNNREYDSLSKEIEFQNLEIELANKKIKDSTYKIEVLKEDKNKAEDFLNERKEVYEEKRNELESIVSETEKEEETLLKKSTKAEKVVDERLLLSYKRIRKNSRNGLAVVSIERDSCGGCFSKIPPQKQLDIKSHKKIIVCEHCGRILIDSEILETTV